MSVHNDKLLHDTGIPDMENASVVIAYTEWNDIIVEKLLRACEQTLEQYKVGRISKVEVPGSFELPFACKRTYEAMAEKKQAPDALIALGCVIRGGTPHFDYVCQAVTSGITELNLHLPVPVIFGVLTVDDLAQAEARAGGEHGNKGEEAALTALKMISFARQLDNL